MKKVITPKQDEEAIFYTDFKGKLCGDGGSDFSIPPVDLTIEFNYNSIHDGESLSLHLDDEEVIPILDVIKQNMSEDYKKSLKDRLKKTEKSYEESVQMRDWGSSEYGVNSVILLKYMLDIKDE
jgi:hypothetical protein